MSVMWKLDVVVIRLSLFKSQISIKFPAKNIFEKKNGIATPMVLSILLNVFLLCILWHVVRTY